ncbi:MAG: sigma-54-dependent transcriptional regulator [Myxococcota bacterium]
MRILLADDEPSIRLSLSDALDEAGHSVLAVSDGEQAWKRLQTDSFDIVISDIRMPGLDGMSLFERTRELCPDTDFLLMTAYAEVEDAVRALKDGAVDYILKPFDLDEIRVRVERLEAQRSLQKQLAQAREELEQQDPIRLVVGQSPSMVALGRLMETVADSDAPVLISGESGTGKELVARTIHRLSPRGASPFIAVNCAAFPETLLEAELFGHEKGAFTGAHTQRIGRFEAARGGTLLLDEVAEIPMTAQAKLLRVLQDGTFEPLGTNQTVQTDVRILSATHRDLRQRIQDGLFREDLFFRLNVLDLHIPPLRERRSDLPILIEHFLRKHVRPGRPIPNLSPSAFAALSEYPFPGNVRELEHAVHRAVVLSRSDNIELHHLPSAISGPALPTLAESDDPGIRPLQDALKLFEREYLTRALRSVDGKKAKAAELLGISRKNLWEKLKAHGVGDPDSEA